MFRRPVVELIDVLDVAEDDVVLVAEAGGDVLGAAGHLPQVRLEKHFNLNNALNSTCVIT